MDSMDFDSKYVSLEIMSALSAARLPFARLNTVAALTIYAQLNRQFVAMVKRLL